MCNHFHVNFGDITVFREDLDIWKCKYLSYMYIIILLYNEY